MAIDGLVNPRWTRAYATMVMLGDLGEPARPQHQLLHSGAAHLILQQVPHDHQQLLRVAMRDLQVARGLLRQVQVVLGQFQVADHRGQRGAQLMGHRGNELLLRADRLEVRGDVGEHHHRPGPFAVPVEDLPRRDGEGGTVLTRRARRDQVVAEGLLQHRPAHRALVRRDRQRRPRVAQQQLRLARVVVSRRGGEGVDPPLPGVHEDVVAVRVDDHDAHVHGVQDALQQLSGGVELADHRLPLRDGLLQPLVAPIQQAQRPLGEQADLQHRDGQQQRVRQDHRVQLPGAHQRGHRDRHGDREQ